MCVCAYLDHIGVVPRPILESVSSIWVTYVSSNSVTRGSCCSNINEYLSNN